MDAGGHAHADNSWDRTEDGGSSDGTAVGGVRDRAKSQKTTANHSSDVIGLCVSSSANAYLSNTYFWVDSA